MGVIFFTYVAIVAEAHPERVGDMLAYMRLIIREASKFGGSGWLTYDAVFCRNQGGLSSPWNYFDASLHQVYIANQRDKVAIPCKHCHEIDHPASDCAVASVLPRTLSSLSEPSLPSPSAWVSKANALPPTAGRDPSVVLLRMVGTASFRANVPMHMYAQTAMGATQYQLAGSAPTQALPYFPSGPAKCD